MPQLPIARTPTSKTGCNAHEDLCVIGLLLADSQYEVAQYASQDAEARRVEEEAHVDEGEEERPNRSEEQKLDVVAHVGGQEVMACVVSAREPCGDRKLWCMRH